jgi:hypothetical protein
LVILSNARGELGGTADFNFWEEGVALRTNLRFLGLLFTAAIAAAGYAEGAPACGGQLEVACNIGNSGKKAVTDTANTAKKAVDDTMNAARRAIDDAAKAADKAKSDGVDTAKRAIDDAGNAAKKALDETSSTAHKAVDDTAWAVAKAADDLIDAGKAIRRFIDRQVKGYRDSLSDAEKRLRE